MAAAVPPEQPPSATDRMWKTLVFFFASTALAALSRALFKVSLCLPFSSSVKRCAMLFSLCCLWAGAS